MFWFANGKEPACQCRQYKRLGFDPWVRKILWNKKWHPTPGFLPGKHHGQRSLTGYSSWGPKELDMTRKLSTCVLCQRNWFQSMTFRIPSFLLNSVCIFLKHPLWSYLNNNISLSFSEHFLILSSLFVMNTGSHHPDSSSEVKDWAAGSSASWQSPAVSPSKE